MGWGGQEIRVLGEMHAMRDRGHQVYLASPIDSEIYIRASDSNFQPWALDVRKPTLPISIFRLANRLRSNGIQIVNPHSSADGWVAGLAGRLARTPLIIRSRHIDVDYKKRKSSHWSFGKLPHHVLTTSERISDGLVSALGLNPDRVDCIPTGIDLNQFHPNIKGNLHNELGLADDVPLIGMVSVIRSWKGHDYFVEAAKIVAQCSPDVHFVVAGGGNDRRLEKIQRWVNEAGLKDYFHLLGHRMDVPNLLASYSMLVLPSTGHEGIPQIILQSHAMQCPIVSTTVGGIPEVVENGRTGVLVSPNNPTALADAIRKLLQNKNLGQRMSEAGRKMVEARHSVDHMCHRLEKLYYRYLGGNNTPSRDN